MCIRDSLIDGFQLVSGEGGVVQGSDVVEDLLGLGRADEDAVNAMVAKITEEVGHINILVNNAGFGVCGSFLETSGEKELSMAKVNVCLLYTSPFVLELGCGKGGFISQLASAHPENNYLCLLYTSA